MAKLPAPGAGIYPFYFTCFFTVEGERYMVFVTDKTSKLHRFFMQRRDGLWTIVNTKHLHGWILELEVKLAKVL